MKSASECTASFSAGVAAVSVVKMVRARVKLASAAIKSLSPCIRTSSRTPVGSAQP